MALAFDATALIAAGNGEMAAVATAELILLAEEDDDTIAVGPLGLIHAYRELHPDRCRALAALIDGSEVIHIMRLDATALCDVAEFERNGVDQAVAEAVIMARDTDTTIATYAAEAYRESCDVLMFDWFPIGWMPIETFYSQLRIARLAAGKKPFFVVIQAFDWARYPDLMPAGNYRKPTAAEVKAMTIWAAMNGANGIAYYPFDDGHFSLEEAPEISTAIKEAVAIVRDYDWLFESPRVWIDYPFQFQSSADKTNAIAETSIAIRAARSREYPRTTFIVAANTTARTIVVKPLLQLDEATAEIVFAPLEVKFLTAHGAGMAN